ncbi:hypothetical protein PI124_g347 [Phytophthora idaei]|nr:hypothetical protein PI125_g1343 [Phytophthora idaei]KAG3170496.1 hypothetical protein PI126_g2354 [Phytophthora idaei]KAG3255039.1 hypothetical protein PI124_g347 [Phytophthora idaei]
MEVTVAGGAVIEFHDSAKLDLRLQPAAVPVYLNEVNRIVLEGHEE